MMGIKSAFVCLKGFELQKDEADFLRTYNPMGLTLFKRNIDNPQQLKKLTDDIKTAVGRDDFLIAIDQEGGLVRRMRPPHWREYVSQQQLGLLDEPLAQEAIKLHADLISDDLQSMGINVNFSPVSDTLHPDTTGAIASRCFSTDSSVVGKYASLLAKTYMENGICPCIKHLPGHGLANTDSHIGLPVIDAPMDLIQRDFLPFQQMANFVPFGMTAHVVLPMIDDKPITQSKKGIDFIRNEIGFDGLLITDAIEMKALSGSLVERARASLDAGCDVVCYCSGHDQNNPEMVAENISVLKACPVISDKTYERLQKVVQVIKQPYQAKDISFLAGRYNDLVQSNQAQTNGPDCTENWANLRKVIKSR
ncbi:MAG: glycoside hydrolase family 3 protein [Alphaproteobacteria bacterium]|nr:glycoside hydrolase family 3 protein [Alphaproteobacteria bacterium]